jgi:hypothetical protein
LAAIVNFERLYDVVLDMCGTKETLSELINAEHYAGRGKHLGRQIPGEAHYTGYA